jgi:hypothetical protein
LGILLLPVNTLQSVFRRDINANSGGQSQVSEMAGGSMIEEAFLIPLKKGPLYQDAVLPVSRE